MQLDFIRKYLISNTSTPVFRDSAIQIKKYDLAFVAVVKDLSTYQKEIQKDRNV